jgi:hypothetical protein
MKYGDIGGTMFFNRFMDFDYQSIGGNFFPVNSAIAIRDFRAILDYGMDDCEFDCEIFNEMRDSSQGIPPKVGQRQLLVMNDRSQAGSVLKPGQIQLM